MESDSSEIVEADFEFEVSAAGEGTRLDSLVSQLLQEETAAHGGILPGLDVVPSRSKIAQWIADGFVQVNYETVGKPAYRAAAGALISVTLPVPRKIALEPDPAVAINVVYEDEDLLVLNKPPGLVVHPGAGQECGTLVNGLLAYLGEGLRQVGDALRPGIVHRLDKDTSGLMVVAKNDRSYQGLVRQFLPPRTIFRKYLALTIGLPGGSIAESGVIELPIGRHPVQRKKMSVVFGQGREAVTEWRIAERLAQGYLLELSLRTGRTHQIRVHLQQMNAPLVGDPVYGKPLSSLPGALREPVKAFGRQALHAAALAFVHPIKQENLEFVSEPPPEMLELIELFRRRP